LAQEEVGLAREMLREGSLHLETEKKGVTDTEEGTWEGVIAFDVGLVGTFLGDSGRKVPDSSKPGPN